MAVRSAMHEAGATALTQLLQFDPPGPNQRQLPCPCGHSAKYFGLRSKPVLTAVGEAQCLRPYYLCEHCHPGQFPVDVDLDIEHTELSPGVAVCWPTGSSSGQPPSITARYFSSCPSDSTSRWTPCPPKVYASGRRRITVVFGYDAPHSSPRGTSTLPNNALLSTHYALC